MIGTGIHPRGRGHGWAVGLRGANVAAILIALGAGAVAQSRLPRGIACPTGKGEAHVVIGIGGDGSLRLSDGRTIRFAGLDFGLQGADVAASSTYRRQLEDALIGEEVAVEPAAGTDRWGREMVFLSRPDAAGGDGMALMRDLAARGLARGLVGQGVDHCLGAVLAAERTARRQRAGLWSLDGARPIDAGDPAGLKKAQGRYTIVEGRILSVGDRPNRVYLNFGRRFSRDFAATVRASLAGQFKSAGFPMASLAHKRVILRGYIGGLAAPRMEILSRAQIEVVENEAE